MMLPGMIRRTFLDEISKRLAKRKNLPEETAVYVGRE
jgi:hypothetical protein